MCNDTEKGLHRSKDLGQEEQMSKLEENWVDVDSKLPGMQTSTRTQWKQTSEHKFDNKNQSVKSFHQFNKSI